MMQSRLCWWVGAWVLWTAWLSGAQAQDYKRLEVHPSTVTVRAGSAVRFTAIATWDDGTMETPPAVRWSATGGEIDAQGKYAAGRKAGSYTVTARLGKHQATATVVVRVVLMALVRRVEVVPREARIRPGQTMAFKAVAYDREDRPVPVKVAWQVTGKGTISPAGLFKATAPGKYTVTAQVRGTPKRAVAHVTVGRRGAFVAMVQIHPPRFEMAPGQMVAFVVRAFDLQMRPVLSTVVWEATGGRITQRGIYLAGSKPGTYAVTAKDTASGLKATAQVRIVDLSKPKEKAKEEAKGKP